MDGQLERQPTLETVKLAGERENTSLSRQGTFFLSLKFTFAYEKLTDILGVQFVEFCQICSHVTTTVIMD